MKVEINLSFIKKHKITPTQYIILHLAAKQKDKELNSLVASNQTLFGADVADLLERDLLIKENNVHRIADLYKTLFAGDGYFEELVLAFPTSVIRPDGVRDQLRTDKKRSKVRYNRVAKTRDVHEHIVKCLKFEVQERTRLNTLKFMKKLPNWISSETWKEWEDKLEHKELFTLKEEGGAYGTKVI